MSDGMITYTPAHREALRQYLATHALRHGVGTEESACSVAAMNIAMSGCVTAQRPSCMSEVIHAWCIGIQDRMPLHLLNSKKWKGALLDAPGTGIDHEPERRALVMEWMWASLELVQPAADRGGYGTAWATMLRERSAARADDAAVAAYAHAAVDAHTAAAANAANAVADDDAAHAYTAYTAAASAAASAAWRKINPAALLRRLNEVTQ